MSIYIYIYGALRIRCPCLLFIVNKFTVNANNRWLKITPVFHCSGGPDKKSALDS